MEKNDKKTITLIPSLLNKPAFKFNDSFECPFCSGEQRYIRGIIKEEVKNHLIITKDLDGHIHVHGPVGNKIIIKEFILAICRESGIEIED